MFSAFVHDALCWAGALTHGAGEERREKFTQNILHPSSTGILPSSGMGKNDVRSDVGLARLAVQPERRETVQLMVGRRTMSESGVRKGLEGPTSAPWGGEGAGGSRESHWGQGSDGCDRAQWAALGHSD